MICDGGRDPRLASAGDLETLFLTDVHFCLIDGRPLCCADGGFSTPKTECLSPIVSLGFYVSGCRPLCPCWLLVACRHDACFEVAEAKLPT